MDLQRAALGSMRPVRSDFTGAHVGVLPFPATRVSPVRDNIIGEAGNQLGFLMMEEHSAERNVIGCGSLISFLCS